MAEETMKYLSEMKKQLGVENAEQLKWEDQEKRDCEGVPYIKSYASADKTVESFLSLTFP